MIEQQKTCEVWLFKSLLNDKIVKQLKPVRFGCSNAIWSCRPRQR